MNYRVAVEEREDLETTSIALKPVDYCNWFFDGEPSPLRLGIGIMNLDSNVLIHPDIVSDEKLHVVLRLTGLAGTRFLYGVVAEAAH